MNTYTISSEKLATETNRQDYDLLLENLPKIPNLKTAVFEFIQTIHNKRTGSIIEVRLDGKLVAAALFYTKNKNTDKSTTSLYSIFSVSPGAGKVAFNAYWEYCLKNSRWYKFYVNKHAHDFYAKMSFKYWGVSKGGDNYSTFGLVLHSDPKKSNEAWNNSYNTLSYADNEYLLANLKVFNEKTKFGLPKLKKQYKVNFESNLSTFEIEPPFEII